jgi:hypothetical protein
MNQPELIKTIKRLLRVEDELSFLEKLTTRELETLIAYIRERLDSPPPKKG